jgi:hypothetical protein
VPAALHDLLVELFGRLVVQLFVLLRAVHVLVVPFPVIPGFALPPDLVAVHELPEDEPDKEVICVPVGL